MYPFSKKSRKKQRTLASVMSLGGLLIVAIGLAANSRLTFFGLNTIAWIGALIFMIGIIYLIDVFD